MTASSGSAANGLAWCDADDRLPTASAAGCEHRRGFGKWVHLADDRLEPAVPKPLREVGEPGPFGFDDEEDGPSAFGGVWAARRW